MTDEEAGAAVELSDEAKEVVEDFQDLEEDQRKEAFLEVVSESRVFWISEVVSSMEDRFDVSTSAPAVAAAPAAGAGDEGGEEEEDEEKAIVNISLEDFGDDKIGVIKAVRGHFDDLGLKEAKSLVEDAPEIIKEGVPREEAEEIKEEIEAAGGDVELK